MTNPDHASDDERTVRYYTELVERYGIDYRALDWGSQKSQRRRFAVLAEVGPLGDSSVLDIGCGLGDLFGWICGEGLQVRYTGLDITPQMIGLAASRFPDARFKVGNLLEDTLQFDGCFDYVFCSGLFTHRQIEPMTFLCAAVDRMWTLCRRGVAFNSLSAWAAAKDSGEFYAEPMAVVEFCHTLTPWVVLRHDYHPNDFTVYLLRNQKNR